MNEMKAFWIYEESEVYAGNSLESIFNEGFFSKEEIEEIMKDNLYGELDLDSKRHVVDENTGEESIMTIKELIETHTSGFPTLLITSNY